MQRLKALRENSNYTQKWLAEMLKTTQQTIARWEAGKAEPGVAALRDLAMIFGTSVDDLLGTNPLSDKVTSVGMHYFNKKAIRDGFWGNFGCLLPGMKHTKWFPITLGTANRVSSALSDLEDGQWLCLSTLNNRMLALNPSKARRLWLLDEACDEPDDWELDDDEYEGNPLEFYRALDAYASDSEEFRSTHSEALLKIIEEFIGERGLDEEKICAFLHHTRIHATDGQMTSYWVEGNRLAEAVFDLEAELRPAMLNLPAFGGDFDSYFPPASLALIDMPLIDVMDAAKAIEAEEAT